MEKPAAAFVSYVRAHSEHQCNYIFKLDDLDLGALASAMAPVSYTHQTLPTKA